MAYLSHHAIDTDQMTDTASSNARNPKSPGRIRKSAGPQRSQAAHAAILAAADALLTEGGPAAVTFEAVARRAKAGKPTIYRWWPTKVALLLELYDNHKNRILNAPDLGDFKSDLIELTRQLWTFWRETSGGSAFAAIIAEAQAHPEAQKSLVDHFSNDIRNSRNVLNVVIDQAIGRGELPEDTDVQAVREAAMAVNWYHLICGKLEEHRISPVVTRFVDGILPRK